MERPKIPSDFGEQVWRKRLIFRAGSKASGVAQAPPPPCPGRDPEQTLRTIMAKPRYKELCWRFITAKPRNPFRVANSPRALLNPRVSKPTLG